MKGKITNERIAEEVNSFTIELVKNACDTVLRSLSILDGIVFNSKFKESILDSNILCLDYYDFCTRYYKNGIWKENAVVVLGNSDLKYDNFMGVHPEWFSAFYIDFLNKEVLLRITTWKDKAYIASTEEFQNHVKKFKNLSYKIIKNETSGEIYYFVSLPFEYKIIVEDNTIIFRVFVSAEEHYDLPQIKNLEGLNVKNAHYSPILDLIQYQDRQSKLMNLEVSGFSYSGLAKISEDLKNTVDEVNELTNAVNIIYETLYRDHNAISKLKPNDSETN